jgi:hypothetical protein
VEIKKGQSREAGNIDEEKHNTICVGHHYTQTNTNNVNKTYVLLQTTGGNDTTHTSCESTQFSFLCLYFISISVN